ncbi:MAG: sulfur carrier protein ThiS [Bacteroidia bacterium]|nr:sulfur carrier protein ThiS [Bacteroidia bacterium]
MRVQLNGEPLILPDDTENIETLLRHLRIDPQQIGIAVAVNRRVIPRSQWREKVLSDGDQIELVYARQGG